MTKTRRQPPPWRRRRRLQALPLELLALERILWTPSVVAQRELHSRQFRCSQKCSQTELAVEVETLSTEPLKVWRLGPPLPPPLVR